MKFSKALALTLLLILLAMSVVAQSTSPNLCSVATLKGTYGLLEEGTVLAQFPGLPPPPFPVVLGGIITFDGAGNLAGTYTASMGGVIVPGTATGTYAVNPDCTYSDVITELGGPGGHHVGTITGTGMLREVDYMYTDPWLVASGTLRKTPLGGCSQETLRGMYALFGQGLGSLPNCPPLLPGSHVGIFTANGHGKLSGKETVNLAGTVGAEQFTATYTVNADCSMTATINTMLGVIHEVGTITGEGSLQQARKIIIDSGWVFADTDKKQ